MGILVGCIGWYGHGISEYSADCCAHVLRSTMTWTISCLRRRQRHSAAWRSRSDSRASQHQSQVRRKSVPVVMPNVSGVGTKYFIDSSLRLRRYRYNENFKFVKTKFKLKNCFT